MNSKAKRNLRRPKERGIKPLADGRYLVRWRVRGCLRQKICATITRAREIQHSIKTKIKEGRYFEKIENRKVGFEEAAHRFLEFSRANLRPATTHEDERYVSGWLTNSLFSGRYLVEITAGDIELYKQQLGRRPSRAIGATPATRLSKRAIDVEIGRLKRLFKLAAEWDLIDRSPAAGVKLHQQDNARSRFLSENEELRLLTSSSPNLRAVIRFAILTGLRKGEIIGLRWHDIDLTRCQLVIHAARAKGKRSRHVPLNDSAFEILKRLPAPVSPDALVFPNQVGRPMENLHHHFRRAARAAGLKGVSFHTLRHTFASRIVMATGSLVEARELLGHRDYRVTLRYAHLTDAHLRKAIKKIG